MQRNADGVNELMQSVQSSILPQLQSAHQISGVKHAVVKRPVIEQGELVASLAGNLAFLLGLGLVELGNVSAKDVAEVVKSFLGHFLVEEHAGHADDCVPQVVIVGLVEVSHQAIGRVRARIAEEVVSVVILNLALD